MRHIDDGTLRRLHDEPLVASEAQKRHLDACGRCRRREAEIALDASSTRAMFDSPTFDAVPALTRLRARIDGERLQPVATRRAPRPAKRFGPRAWLAGGVGVAALAGALLFTPAGSLAQTFITIFQPTQIRVVPVTAGELKTLPKLRKYGTVHIHRGGAPKRVTGAASASQAAGMDVLVPSSLPSGIPSTVTYEVAPGTLNSFTFSAAKARAAARAAGKTAPPMPANIDGSTLQFTTYPVAVAIYGGVRGIPALAIGQTRAPRVSSTGVTVKELEDYILSLPGVSPQLAASIRAIGDPTSTLPIPVPVNLAQATQVTVQGVNGLAVGDSTGLGSGVIWEKGGIIYGVGGPLPESQVIDIANSLH